jgi:hypothetical protein
MVLKLFSARKSDSPAPGLASGPAHETGRNSTARRWARVSLYAAAAVFPLTLLLIGLIVQSEPVVAPNPQPAQHYLSRTRTLIRNTVHAGTNDANQKQLVLTAEDLTAAANFVLLRKKLAGHAECTIEARRLELAASIRLPIKAVKLFLNIHLTVDDADPQATIQRLKLGRLSVPSPLVGWLVHGALHYTPLARYSRIAEPLVRRIRIQDDGRLALTLIWNRDVLAQAEGLITDLADKERLLVYHDKLAEIVGQPHLKRFVRLGPLLQSLFALARSRSESDNDPVAENRALIIVLGAYVNGKNLAPALSSVQTPSRLIQRDVLLNRRIDTAQHFMGSATLAMAGHNALVDMIGLAKEMNDTHNGSGFSFIDLAADQAGALFGKMAVRSEEKARKVQEVLSRGADESLFIPMLKDLPEKLTSASFAERFKDIDSPEFHAMKARIEERILACPLYRP